MMDLMFKIFRAILFVVVVGMLFFFLSATKTLEVEETNFRAVMYTQRIIHSLIHEGKKVSDLNDQYLREILFSNGQDAFIGAKITVKNIQSSETKTYYINQNRYEEYIATTQIRTGFYTAHIVERYVTLDDQAYYMHFDWAMKKRR